MLKRHGLLWTLTLVGGCLTVLAVIVIGYAGLVLLTNSRSSSTLEQATPTLFTHPTLIKIPIPTDKANCDALGGKWGKIGIGPVDQCNLPTRDAGSTCSDSSQCEGRCVADLSQTQRNQITQSKTPIKATGKCSPWRITVGCLAVVESGQVNGILCID